jgi:hypothetical protein
MELVCRDLVNAGKPVYTFPLEETEALAKAGTEPIQLSAYLKKPRRLLSPG